MSTFDTANMADALGDVTNDGTYDATNGVDPSSTNDKEEFKKIAADKGWVAPTAYDYDGLNAGNNYTAQATQAMINAGESSNTSQWGHAAAKYEWQDDFGDIGPEVPELEQQLFRSEHINRMGLKLDNLKAFQVIVESEVKVQPISDFKSAGLHPIMVSNIEKCGYVHPTPIQAYTIPTVLQSRDMIATAQTGSGKTAAFLIPCLSKLMGKAKKLAAPRPNLGNGFNSGVDTVRAEPLVLVVAPTRELCCQIFDEARRLCYRSMLRPCVAYGGGPKREQHAELSKGCDILIATPGRLLDFMSMPDVLSLSRLRYTIIDEADELLHDDWEMEMAKIMAGGDTNEDGDHRYMLFSATFDKNMRKLAKKYLANDHVRVRIGRAGSTHVNVRQQVFWVENNEKQRALYDLIIAMPPSRTIVFVNAKRTADYVDDFLFNHGLPVTSIHSDRTQREREDALRAFRTGVSPILVATGVSARGLDVKNVMHVVNYDLPSIEHDGQNEYIHRIGRTARIGNEGLATSFYNDRNEPISDFIAKIMLENGQELPDFWADKKISEGETVAFEDDSDADEDEDTVAATGSSNAWGNSGDAAPEQEEGW